MSDQSYTEREVFAGKNFSSLLKDIYDNSTSTKAQIKLLINELKTYITSISDAALIVPLLKDYLDISVKNDDELVKMAQIIQRIISSENRTVLETGGAGIMTDKEREELLNSLEDSTNELKNQEMETKKEVESVSDKITDVKNKLGIKE